MAFENRISNMKCRACPNGKIMNMLKHSYIVLILAEDGILVLENRVFIFLVIKIYGYDKYYSIDHLSFCFMFLKKKPLFCESELCCLINHIYLCYFGYNKIETWTQANPHCSKVNYDVMMELYYFWL